MTRLLERSTLPTHLHLHTFVGAVRHKVSVYITNIKSRALSEANSVGCNLAYSSYHCFHCWCYNRACSIQSRRFFCSFSHVASMLIHYHLNTGICHTTGRGCIAFPSRTRSTEPKRRVIHVCRLDFPLDISSSACIDGLSQLILILPFSFTLFWVFSGRKELVIYRRFDEDDFTCLDLYE